MLSVGIKVAMPTVENTSSYPRCDTDNLCGSFASLCFKSLCHGIIVMGVAQECALVNTLKKSDGAEVLTGPVSMYEIGY